MVVDITCNKCKRNFVFDDKLRILLSMWFQDRENDIDICPGCLMYSPSLNKANKEVKYCKECNFRTEMCICDKPSKDRFKSWIGPKLPNKRSDNVNNANNSEELK